MGGLRRAQRPQGGCRASKVRMQGEVHRGMGVTMTSAKEDLGPQARVPGIGRTPCPQKMFAGTYLFLHGLLILYSSQTDAAYTWPAGPLLTPPHRRPSAPLRVSAVSPASH